jgi:hypothetical protein
MKKIFIFVTIFLLPVLTLAYPKFAALTGEKCMSCHVNPDGSGIRNAYGLKYAKENLFLKPLKKANESMEFNTQLTKGIQIGADMRMMFVDIQRGEGNPDLNSFFQMQSDLYIYAKMNKYLHLVIAPAFNIPANDYPYTTFAVKSEIYGMVSNLPAGLFFKVGRFIPNFGLRIAEHRAYNRMYNDFYTPYAADAGIEVGISPSYFTLTAGISNGTSYDKNGRANNSYDFDAQKQFTTTGDFRWASKNGRYAFGIGGSFISNPFKYDTQNNVNALKNIGAAFLSIGLFDRVAILGEISYNRLQIRDSVNTKIDSKMIFSEIDIRVIKGLELKFQFEDYNPQLGDQTNSQKRRRYSFGAIVYPMTGLEIEAVYRVIEEPGLKKQNPSTDIKNNEYQAVFKFYF